MSATIAALVAAMLTALVSPVPAIPSCVRTVQSSESHSGRTIPAPVVSPKSGRRGTVVSISGAGFGPGARITVAALYGEDGCTLQGLGDQFLGTARADASGGYRLSVRWPSRFVPVLGRERVKPMSLPPGRYFVIAMACAARAACSFPAGSKPGGPFVLSASQGVSRMWAIPAGAIVLGLAAWVRRRRSAR
jgi:hypothetical protein